MSRARELADVASQMDSIAAMLMGRGVALTTEDDGTPTGGFMWSEANANGTYIRFADGTQICWGTITTSSTDNVTWTFPASFVSAPRVFGTGIAGNSVRNVVASVSVAASAGFSVRDGTNTRVADTVHVMAVGRWY